MRLLRESADRATSLLKCRLCMRIALIVCLSIVAIEIAILVPSYLGRQAELHRQLEDEGLGIMVAAARAVDHHPLYEILGDLTHDLPRSRLLGGSIHDGTGALLGSFGQPPKLSSAPPRTGTSGRRRWVSGDRLEVMESVELGARAFTLVARLDTTGVREELDGFVLRVSGLVLLISLFVSAATIGANGVLVITPLLEIRRTLNAALDDPKDADRYTLDIRRDDEIGETATGLNALLTRLADVRRMDVADREQRLKDFGDASSDWYWEMDEQLRFSYFSDRFTEVTGVPQEALLGKTRQQTGIPGVDIEAWRRHLADLAACRPFRDFEHPRTLSSGRTVFLSINGKPIFDQDGTFKGYRGTGRDITEQKLREYALLEAKQTAELANRTKSEFLANMSHELRTPLNAIIGFTQIMKAGTLGPIDNPRYVEYLNDIHESGQHLLDLINDILDLSKIETGTVKLQEERVDISTVIATAIKLVRSRADAGRLEIHLDLPRDPMPLLWADSRAFKQTLANLLSNAVKFTEPGGRIDVAVRCDREDGCRISISDTGIGIEAEDIPKALARFQQVEGRLDRKYDGSGLGLPLAKSLIELHGGSLELDSEVGVGTTVTITLPPARIVSTDAAAKPGRSQKSA